MSNILKEIFFNLIYINGIISLIMLSYKLFIKIFFTIYYSKKDEETFERRWEDCE